MGKSYLLLCFLLFTVCGFSLIGCGKKKTTEPPPTTGNQDRFLIIGNYYDLILKDITQQSYVALTTDGSSIEDYNANFSQDGGQIVWQRYSSQNLGTEHYQVWVMNRDGQNKSKIASGMISPVGACSPDNKVVFWADDVIRIVDFFGITLGMLADDGWDKFEPQWSPAGDRIAYIAGKIYDHPPETYRDTTDIYVINTDGSNKTRVTTTSQNEIFFRWAPIGNKLAFIRKIGTTMNLCVLELATLAETLIAENVSSSANGYHYPICFDWSKDGSRILYISAIDNNLYSVSASGGSTQNISHGVASEPCVSAGGQKIAYSTETSIIVSDPNGSDPQTVFTSATGPDVDDFH